MEITVGSVVIVGCGSIGKRHLHQASKFSKRIIIIDPIFPGQVLNDKKEYSKIEWFPKIGDMPSFSFNAADIGVIANWGPDHFSTFLQLVELGITRIVLEKPMVCSISELNKMLEIVHEKRIHIVVNQGWHYINLAERIKDLAAKKALGPIAMINASGGARCMSTTGSHIIHLAHQLLDENFVKLSGDFGDMKINPRDRDLSYLDGSLHICFSSNRYLNLSYSNLSSIEGKIEIYWQDAIGILEDDQLEVIIREPDLEFASSVTRYGKPTKGIFSGVLPLGDNIFTEQLEGLYVTLIHEKFEILFSTFNSHYNSNKTLLLSLISNHRERTIYSNESLSLEEIEMKFKIS